MDRDLRPGGAEAAGKRGDPRLRRPDLGRVVVGQEGDSHRRSKAERRRRGEYVAGSTLRAVRQARRRFIAEQRNLRDSRILEVGALDSPTFPEFDVSYLDWFSQDELREMVAGNPRRNPDLVVRPDFVVKTKRFAQHLQGSMSAPFDAIIANHVFEHLADPLTWLQELGEVAGEDACLFLTIPDRRYTFDYMRPVSTVVDILRANVEDLECPSYWQVLEAAFYYRPFKASEAWAGEEPRPAPRLDLQDAMAAAERAEHEYVDTHCHVFTTDSASRLFDALAGLTGWRPFASQDVAEGSNEFYVCLRKAQP